MDLARLALILGVAGLDAYLHRLVLSRIAGQSISNPLPKELRKLSVTLGDLATLGHDMVQARTAAKPKATKPMTRVRNVMHRVLGTETFQSPHQVVRALGLCGKQKPWTSVGRALGVPPNEIMDRLSQIVKRRNQIVHEGDYARLVRPQNLRRNKMRSADVAADLDWLENLIKQIDAL